MMERVPVNGSFAVLKLLDSVFTQAEEPSPRPEKKAPHPPRGESP
ncbi:hypothetical protein B0G77_6638 [Paraburkholderia sp. BL10I2N1]|nr:hypothetical protein B0G77_6638 [Paraburkholderia sp. BL10I2N1]